jgi:hypothetical protein
MHEHDPQCCHLVVCPNYYYSPPPQHTNATSFSKWFMSLVNGFSHRCFYTIIHTKPLSNQCRWLAWFELQYTLRPFHVSKVRHFHGRVQRQPVWLPRVLGFKWHEPWSVTKALKQTVLWYHYPFAYNTFSNWYTLILEHSVQTKATASQQTACVWSESSLRQRPQHKMCVNGFLKITYEHMTKAWLIMMGWEYVSELQPPTGLLFTPHIIYEYGQPRWNDTDGKTEELGEKPVTVALCPPQIPHGITHRNKFHIYCTVNIFLCSSEVCIYGNEDSAVFCCA